MAFFEPTLLAPKSAKDCKASIFSFDTKEVHKINQIDFHK